jgi:hypothetical protein
MSRFSPEEVWKHTFADLDKAECPCCRTSMLYRDALPKPGARTKRNWAKGHIVPDKDRSFVTNVLINMRPLCIPCNSPDKYPKYKSNFHYSEYIGGISPGEAEKLYQELVKNLIDIQKNPSIIECNSAGCRNLKKARSDFCGVCMNKIERQKLKILKASLSEEQKIEREFEKHIESLYSHIRTHGMKEGYLKSIASLVLLASELPVGKKYFSLLMEPLDRQSVVATMEIVVVVTETSPIKVAPPSAWILEGTTENFICPPLPDCSSDEI